MSAYNFFQFILVLTLGTISLNLDVEASGSTKHRRNCGIKTGKVKSGDSYSSTFILPSPVIETAEWGKTIWTKPTYRVSHITHDENQYLKITHDKLNRSLQVQLTPLFYGYCDRTRSNILNFKITLYCDNGEMEYRHFQLNVQPINDHPPEFDSKVYHIRVERSWPRGLPLNIITEHPAIVVSDLDYNSEGNNNNNNYDVDYDESGEEQDSAEMEDGLIVYSTNASLLDVKFSPSDRNQTRSMKSAGEQKSFEFLDLYLGRNVEVGNHTIGLRAFDGIHNATALINLEIFDILTKTGDKINFNDLK